MGSQLSTNDITQSSAGDTIPPTLNGRDLSLSEATTPFSMNETTKPLTYEAMECSTSDTTPSASNQLQQNVIEKPLSRFERAPGEIRNQIYKYLLSSEYATIVKKKKSDHTQEQLNEIEYLGTESFQFGMKSYKYSTAIFCTNKTIGRESRFFFYHENRFVKLVTNSIDILSCATVNVPVVYEKDAEKFSRHVYEAVIVARPRPRAFVQAERRHHEVVLVANDVPIFIEHLRIIEASEGPGFTLQASLRMRTSPTARAAKKMERLVLEPFKELVRVARCQVVGARDRRYAIEVENAMLRRPPIGPDIIKLCERVRKESLSAGGDDYVRLVYGQYLRAITLFYKCLGILPSSVEVDPQTRNEIQALTAEYMLELSLFLVNHELFSKAVEFAEDGVKFIEGFPDFPSQLRARAQMQLGLIKLRATNPNNAGAIFDDSILTPEKRASWRDEMIAEYLVGDDDEFERLLPEMNLQVYAIVREAREPSV